MKCGHAERKGDMRTAYILQEYLKGRNHLDGRWRILKLALKIEE
jgi:hypothetical protein